MKDQDLIARAIEGSGLSARAFAMRIMGRDERTVRRWETGEVAIPAVAREWLERWLELSDQTRERIVGSLS